MTNNSNDPDPNFRDIDIALTVVALLDPTIPRPARAMIVDALDTGLRTGSSEAMRRASFALAVAVRSLPSIDSWRLAGCIGDPYEGLATNTVLHWDERELTEWVRRWDGLPPVACRLLLGNGTVARINRSMRETAPADRVAAYGDALAAVWRRLTSYGVTLPQFAMTLRGVRSLGPEKLDTREADARAKAIRPPSGLVPIVTCSSGPAPSPNVLDAGFEEPPF